MIRRLAILTSHPIQYYAPWFRHMASDPEIEIKVFYLWDFGVRPTHDPGFNKTFVWDVPLLEGYEHAFVPNTSSDPGTHHRGGLRNPALIKTVLEWKADAVLLIGFSQDSFLKWIVHKPGGLPLLLKGDSHRLAPETSFSSRLKDLAASFLFKRIDAFLYCGQANQNYFLHRGVRNSNLFFSPHAVDLDRFDSTSELHSKSAEWRSGLGIHPDHQIILFAGKYEEKKHPLDLLRAYLSCRTAQTRLLFVGSGPLESQLKKEAKGSTDILFCPMFNQSRMPVLYHAADLFVLPSYGPHETWGLAVQESLACGTPVIVSSHVGCHPDLVQNKNNGIVFEAGSLTALETALQQALKPGQLQAWQPNCRKSLSDYTYVEATHGLKRALNFVLS